MKKLLIWLPLTVALAFLLYTGGVRLSTGSILDRRFGELPVQSEGRVKPLDTVGRSTLLYLSGKSTISTPDGEKMDPATWMKDVLFQAEVADAYPVFRVDDPDLRSLIKQRDSKAKTFAFEDLKPYLGQIENQATLADEVESPRRTRFQTAVIKLRNGSMLYRRLRNSVRLDTMENLEAEVDSFLARNRKIMARIHANSESPGQGEMGEVDPEVIEGMIEDIDRFRRLGELAWIRVDPTPVLAGKGPVWWTFGEAMVESMALEGATPAIQAYAGMTSAVRREGGGDSYHRHLAHYTSWLQEEMPGTYRRTRMEAAFNRLNPFFYGMTFYVLAGLFAVASWLWKPRPLARMGLHLAVLAFLLHTGGVIARMWIEGRPPVTNLYSSALFVGWGAALLGLIMERLNRNGVGTVCSAMLGFITLLIAHHLSLSGDTMEMMRAVLDSNFWLATHVVTITIGYSATYLAGFLGIVYILRGSLTRSLERKDAHNLYRMAYGTVCFALLLSFVGTVLGGIWADQSWGRFWGWDPKENGALLIVMWNAVILHARWAGWIRERGLMVLAVFGNVITSFSWFGVNMLGVGLHAYGFMDQAFTWLMGFIATQVVIILIGLRPLDKWRSPLRVSSLNSILK